MGTSEDVCTLVKWDHNYVPDCPPHNTINGHGICLRRI